MMTCFSRCLQLDRCINELYEYYSSKCFTKILYFAYEILNYLERKLIKKFLSINGTILLVLTTFGKICHWRGIEAEENILLKIGQIINLKLGPILHWTFLNVLTGM